MDLQRRDFIRLAKLALLKQLLAGLRFAHPFAKIHTEVN